MGEKINVRVPMSPQELVKIISEYKGILTARMHSCIVAYSLGVPAIAFVWCEKLKFWGETINKPECFLPIEQLNSDIAWEKLNNALQYPYDENVRKNIETCHLEFIKKAISIIKNNSC